MSAVKGHLRASMTDFHTQMYSIHDLVNQREIVKSAFIVIREKYSLFMMCLVNVSKKNNLTKNFV